MNDFIPATFSFESFRSIVLDFKGFGKEAYFLREEFFLVLKLLFYDVEWLPNPLSTELNYVLRLYSIKGYFLKKG